MLDFAKCHVHLCKVRRWVLYVHTKSANNLWDYQNDMSLIQPKMNTWYQDFGQQNIT